MLKTAEIVEQLSKSRIFRDYEKAFNQATHLPLALRPHELWQPALQGKKHENPFCALMAKSSRSCAACLQVQQELIEGEPGESTSVICFAGLCDTAIPVSVGSNVVGFLQTGQVALRKPTEAGFSKVAQQLILWGVKVDLNQLQDAYFHSKGKLTQLLLAKSYTIRNCNRRLLETLDDRFRRRSRIFKPFVFKSQTAELSANGNAVEKYHFDSFRARLNCCHNI